MRGLRKHFLKQTNDMKKSKSPARFKERHVYFFECKTCHKPKRQSFRRMRANEGICRSCRKGTVPDNQMDLFGERAARAAFPSLAPVPVPSAALCPCGQPLIASRKHTAIHKRWMQREGEKMKHRRDLQKAANEGCNCGKGMYAWNLHSRKCPTFKNQAYT